MCHKRVGDERGLGYYICNCLCVVTRGVPVGFVRRGIQVLSDKINPLNIKPGSFAFIVSFIEIQYVGEMP